MKHRPSGVIASFTPTFSRPFWMKFARRDLPATVIPAKAGTQYAAAVAMGFGAACCTAEFLLKYLCLLGSRFRGNDDGARVPSRATNNRLERGKAIGRSQNGRHFLLGSGATKESTHMPSLLVDCFTRSCGFAMAPERGFHIGGQPTLVA